MSFAVFAVVCVVVVGFGVYGAQLYYTRRREIDSEIEPDDPCTIPTYEASTRIGQQHMDLAPGMWSNNLAEYPPAPVPAKRVRKTVKKTTPTKTVRKTVKKTVTPKSTKKVKA